MFAPQSIKKLIVFISILLFFSIKSYCQERYDEGFIITLNDEKKNGKLKFLSGVKNENESCNIIIDGVERTYSANEIKGYGVKDQFLFRSDIIKDVFIQTIFEGDISIFKYKYYYILQDIKGDFIAFSKEIRPKQLKEMKELPVTGNWNGVLKVATSKCESEELKEYLERMKLHHGGLIELMTIYHDCQNSDFSVFNTKTKTFKFQYGFSLNFNISNSELSSFDPAFREIENTYSNKSISFGVNSSLFLENFAVIGIYTELNYFSESFSGVKETSTVQTSARHETDYNLNGFSIYPAITFRIALPNSFISFYSGPALILPLSGSSNRYSFRDNGLTTSEVNETPFRVKKSFVGFWAGTSYKMNFGAFNLGVMLRYSLENNFERNVFIESKLNKLTIGGFIEF